MESSQRITSAWIILMILATAITIAAGEAEANPEAEAKAEAEAEAKAEARGIPYHSYPYYNPYPLYSGHIHPVYSPPVYGQYAYTTVCKFIVQRPHLLARLHGLFDYYQKHCLTYTQYPAYSLPYGWR